MSSLRAALLLRWVTEGLHKGPCGTCQAEVASTRSRWMLLGLQSQAVLQHAGPCPQVGGSPCPEPGISFPCSIFCYFAVTPVTGIKDHH